MQTSINYMPPTTDADFLAVLDVCDPVATDAEGFEILKSWSPSKAVDGWLDGFQAARAALVG